MREGKKKIEAYIPDELHEKLLKSNYKITDAVIKGLETVLNGTEEHSLKDEEIKHLNGVIEDLEEQLKANIKPEQLRNKEELIDSLWSQINDLKVQNNDLKEQLKVKDSQLENKDGQIEKLTENMQAQSVHIQTLINQKAIEAPGAKKPWWRFW